jgi:hypothetical protein
VMEIRLSYKKGERGLSLPSVSRQWGKAMWGHTEKVALCKPGSKLSPDLELAGILDLASRLWKISFSCLSYPVCDILLWQPELRHHWI